MSQATAQIPSLLPAIIAAELFINVVGTRASHTKFGVFLTALHTQRGLPCVAVSTRVVTLLLPLLLLLLLLLPSDAGIGDAEDTGLAPHLTDTVHKLVDEPWGRSVFPELMRVIALVFAKLAVDNARKCESHVTHSTLPLVASDIVAGAPFGF